MTFRAFLTDRRGSTADTLLDASERPSLPEPTQTRRRFEPIAATEKRPGDRILTSRGWITVTAALFPSRAAPTEQERVQ